MHVPIKSTLTGLLSIDLLILIIWCAQVCSSLNALTKPHHSAQGVLGSAAPAESVQAALRLELLRELHLDADPDQSRARHLRSRHVHPLLGLALALSRGLLCAAALRLSLHIDILQRRWLLAICGNAALACVVCTVLALGLGDASALPIQTSTYSPQPAQHQTRENGGALGSSGLFSSSSSLDDSEKLLLYCSGILYILVCCLAISATKHLAFAGSTLLCSS